MTKSKTIAAALAALTLATAVGGEVQARPRFGVGLGVGLAAGALIGAAVASSTNAAPAYGYSDCRYVERYDRWGNLRTIRVCDVEPY